MSLVIFGLGQGLILFLLAAGLTLIFGLLGVINFAHGAFYMMGAYLGFQWVKTTGHFWTALFVVPLVLFVLGALIERFTLRPLYVRPHAQQVVLTFGLILIIQEGVRLFWGLDYIRISPPPGFDGVVRLAGAQVGAYRLLACVLSALLAAALLFLLDRTSLGSTIRAAAINPRMLECLGADVSSIRMWAFAGGIALAGLAGTLAAPLTAVDSSLAVTVVVDCFVIVVVGGLGNVRGAIVAALIVGFIRAGGQQFAAEWVDVVTYGLLIATLLVRPSGLFAKSMRVA